MLRGADSSGRLFAANTSDPLRTLNPLLITNYWLLQLSTRGSTRRKYSELSHTYERVRSPPRGAGGSGCGWDATEWKRVGGEGYQSDECENTDTVPIGRAREGHQRDGGRTIIWSVERRRWEGEWRGGAVWPLRGRRLIILPHVYVVLNIMIHMQFGYFGWWIIRMSCRRVYDILIIYHQFDQRV